MPDMINTNILSMQAQQNLSTSQASLATSVQRLSSGLRINSAKDDAAGLAISDRMTSQVNGLTQAASNANNAISLTQTADGGLATTTTLLQTMRTLAVQAANGTNTASDRASIQLEVSQLQQEVNRVASTTQYNGSNLLDGSLTNAQFQVGANANQTISFSIGSSQASAIGSNTVAASGNATATNLTQAHASTSTGVIQANVFAAQALTIQGNGTSVSIPATTLVAGSSGKTIAAAVNTASGSTGVKATATTSATLGAFTAGTVSLTLQGTPLAGNPPTANPITVSATLGSATDLSGLTSAINAQTGTTGITAVADLTHGTIALTNAAGDDIGVTAGAGATGVTVTGSADAGAAGTAVTLAANGSAGDSATVGASVSFSGPASFTVSSSVAAGGIFGGAAASVNTSSLQSVASIDLTKMTNGVPTGANSALAIIDAALANVDSSRASLGAIENRFTDTISNLQTTSNNLTSARSGIEDTDFAAETANLSRSQILQQAGTAMLAQANSLPNGVMALLR
jgi:flagellin